MKKHGIILLFIGGGLLGLLFKINDVGFSIGNILLFILGIAILLFGMALLIRK